MRVVRRIAELLVDPRLELLGDDVLEPEGATPTALAIAVVVARWPELWSL